MADPDVEHAGWAVGGRGSRLRRRRNPLLGLLALVLLVGGVGASFIGIVRLATEAGPSDSRVVARGTVAALDGARTAAVTVSADRAGPFTIWLRAGGASNVRDSIVAGTACDVRRADGTVARVRGSRQGASIETDGHATIGEFTAAAGANAVACEHVRFGSWRNHGRLDQQRPFVVESGSPGDGLRGLWLLLPGIAAALAGGALMQRWRTGSLKPI